MDGINNIINVSVSCGLRDVVIYFISFGTVSTRAVTSTFILYLSKSKSNSRKSYSSKSKSTARKMYLKYK